MQFIAAQFPLGNRMRQVARNVEPGMDPSCQRFHEADPGRNGSGCQVRLHGQVEPGRIGNLNSASGLECRIARRQPQRVDRHAIRFERGLKFHPVDAQLPVPPAEQASIQQGVSKFLARSRRADSPAETGRGKLQRKAGLLVVIGQGKIGDRQRFHGYSRAGSPRGFRPLAGQVAAAVSPDDEPELKALDAELAHFDRAAKQARILQAGVYAGGGEKLGEIAGRGLAQNDPLQLEPRRQQIVVQASSLQDQSLGFLQEPAERRKRGMAHQRCVQRSENEQESGGRETSNLKIAACFSRDGLALQEPRPHPACLADRAAGRFLRITDEFGDPMDRQAGGRPPRWSFIISGLAPAIPNASSRKGVKPVGRIEKHGWPFRLPTV